MVEDYREIVPYVLQWYDYNARILPWREERNPYHTWVSEIMLQQTRVEAVRGYYHRFLEALPDVQALAEASEEQLLKLWEGLGYYSRVRNMQKAAQVIVSRYGGEIPADYGILKTLPGIGAYTAGAIASIAYGIPVPAVDGNVLRVMKRIRGSHDDVTKDSVKRQLFEDLKPVIPAKRPGDFNQAIMDIGATVCVPNGEPHCKDCPVMHLCRAYREETYGMIPYKPAKKERRVEERTILVIEWDGKFLLHRRPAKGLLAGLWELPGVTNRLSETEAGKLAAELTGRNDKSVLAEKEEGQTAEMSPLCKLPDAKHIFSHVEWRMVGYYVRLSDTMGSGNGNHPLGELCEEEYLFATREEIQSRYALPGAFAAYVEWIMKNSGKADKL